MRKKLYRTHNFPAYSESQNIVGAHQSVGYIVGPMCGHLRILTLMLE